LPAAILGRLDQNGDSALERGELLAFLDRPPDLELNLAMGAVSAADRRSSTRVRVEPGWRVRPTPRGGFKLKLGELDIDFVLNNRDPRQADFYDFNAMDADKNGYLEQREADAGNIGRGSFDSMDADGDKKVFKGEFTTFAEEQKAAAAVRLQMEVSDIGQDLFVMLDTDLDGVLSSRELRSAKNILALEDKNGDGVLGGDEIPERMLIEIVRGPEAPSDAEARVARGRTARSANKANTTGPRWFRKMDRNNDGDLSLREFVGPLEAFHKLDADGDGLIDREEAEAASPPSKQEN
jgi:Ca2+-binding EF-hand superfamily protein